MTEDDTTSSSRIFIKILFSELQALLGLKTIAERFKEPAMQDYFQNMFPRDNPRDTRFSINFFTSIGLGLVTEPMREHLKHASALIMEQREAELEARRADDSMSDSGSYSSYTRSSRSRSYSRSPSRGRSYSRSYSRSPRGRSYSRSYSRSPRGRSYSRSYSRLSLIHI